MLLNLVPGIYIEAQDLQHLVIHYPPPMFIGTPSDMKVERLENAWEVSRPSFYVPEGTCNLATDKWIDITGEEPVIGEVKLINDGDKEGVEGSYVELSPGPQYITIDLESTCYIYAIAVWHYHAKARVYFDVIVQISEDPDFITDVKTLFNNDFDNSSGFGAGENLNYIETNEGKLIDGRGFKARFVRLHSNGNNDDDFNHYTEVEIYGKPAD
jgi:hypothetical protein